MTQQRLGHGLLRLLLLALCVSVSSPAWGSCENTIRVKSRELLFEYYDVYPPPEDSAALMRMWNGMARGLATAVRCQQRIESDPNLKAKLALEPLYLAMYAGQRLVSASDQDPHLPAAPDSILALFRSLNQDSTVALLSVRLGSSPNVRRMRALMDDLEELRETEGPEGWDSSLVVDLVHADCSQEWDRARLFLLPPHIARVKSYVLMSGLFIYRRDALRVAERIRKQYGAQGKVMSVAVTGALLRIAIPPQ